MVMEVNYEKFQKEADVHKISKIYLEIGLQFIKMAQNIRAVFIAEEFYKGAIHLVKNEKDIDNGIRFLERCESDVTMVQALNSIGGNSKEIDKLK
jgi:hypothetical protein